MKEFTKKYQLWELSDNRAYSLKEFDTLQDCIAAPKYSSWYVTKRVAMTITDTDEITIAPHVAIQPATPSIVSPDASDTDNSPILDAYLGGARSTKPIS